MSLKTMLGIPATSNAESVERQARLAELTSQVTHGLRNFVRAGVALAAIRDEQLYRVSFKTFEDFCQATWHMTPQHAGRLMEAATIARNLEPMGSIPSSERQARPLAGLKPEDQREAWAEATATGPATVAKVEAAAARRKPGRKRKPKAIRLRVPQAIVIIERKSIDVDTIACLEYAIDQMKAQTSKAA